MNWLTLRLSELNAFSDLARSRLITFDPSLRLVPFSVVREALGNYRLTIEGGFALDRYFLLAEDTESATARAASAVSAPAGVELPSTFTRALDDGSGTVLYLPDGLRRSPDFQLFSVAGQGLSRVRVRGQLDDQSALLHTFEPPARVPCSDGPCPKWREICGNRDRCICMKFEDQRDSFAMSVLPKRFVLGPGRTYELRCVSNV